MRKLLWILVLGLGAAACQKQAPVAVNAPAPAAAPAASAAVRAAALDATLTGLQKVDTHRDDGARHTAISGYFEGGKLRVVEEVASGGPAAPLHNRYYYDDGALFYYSGEMPAGPIGGGPTALAATVGAHAEFRGARVVAAVRSEHYGEVKLDDAATGAIRRQAAELASAITSEEQAPKSR